MLRISDGTHRIDGAVLKYIAVISMFLDHLALTARLYARIPEGRYLGLRAAGRLAFPLFCLLLVQGARHTSDARRYALRLAAFALLSEIPFDLMTAGRIWNPAAQNVLWTLLLCLGMLRAQQWLKTRAFAGVRETREQEADGRSREKRDTANRIYRTLWPLLWLVTTAAFCLGAELFRCDYGWIGSALCAGLSLIPLEIPRGRQCRYFFYIFYPAHMLALYLFWRIV